MRWENKITDARKSNHWHHGRQVKWFYPLWPQRVQTYRANAPRKKINERRLCSQITKVYANFPQCKGADLSDFSCKLLSTLSAREDIAFVLNHTSSLKSRQSGQVDALLYPCLLSGNPNRNVHILHKVNKVGEASWPISEYHFFRMYTERDGMGWRQHLLLRFEWWGVVDYPQLQLTVAFNWAVSTKPGGAPFAASITVKNSPSCCKLGKTPIKVNMPRVIWVSRE